LKLLKVNFNIEVQFLTDVIKKVFLLFYSFGFKVKKRKIIVSFFGSVLCTPLLLLMKKCETKKTVSKIFFLQEKSIDLLGYITIIEKMSKLDFDIFSTKKNISQGSLFWPSSCLFQYFILYYICKT